MRPSPKWPGVSPPALLPLRISNCGLWNIWLAWTPLRLTIVPLVVLARGMLSRMLLETHEPRKIDWHN